MDDNKDVQEKLVLYQVLQKYLEELREQAVVIEKRFIEIEATGQVLDDIKKLKEANDILIPLGSGCYGHGKITDVNNTLIDVGAGVFMNKNPEEAKIFLEKKKAEIDKIAKNIQNEITTVVNKINLLGQEIEQRT